MNKSLNNVYLLDYLRKKKKTLKKLKISEYKKKSEMIIQNELSVSREEIYFNRNYLSKNQISKLDKNFDKLEQDFPVQHIIEKTFFYEEEFFTPKKVFIPRPETEILVDQVHNYINTKNKKLKIVDLCTGSGCIVLSLAKKNPNHQFIGLDISNDAITVSKINSKKLNTSNVEFKNENMFEYIFRNVDIITCNPPYLAANEIEKLERSVKNHDPIDALTDHEDGTSFYLFLIKNFNTIVKNGGTIFFEIPSTNVASKIFDILSQNSTINYDIFKDFEGNNRVIRIY